MNVSPKGLPGLKMFRSTHTGVRRCPHTLIYSKHKHCTSNYSHDVSTGVETVNISKRLKRATVPLIQDTQTPPGDFSKPLTVLKVKSSDFLFK